MSTRKRQNVTAIKTDPNATCMAVSLTWNVTRKRVPKQVIGLLRFDISHLVMWTYSEEG